MIGVKDDGHESLRYRLRTMSDADLIRFGRDARERCRDRQNEQGWIDLKLAREEWRSRHPKAAGRAANG